MFRASTGKNLPCHSSTVIEGDGLSAFGNLGNRHQMSPLSSSSGPRILNESGITAGIRLTMGELVLSEAITEASSLRKLGWGSLVVF